MSSVHEVVIEAMAKSHRDLCDLRTQLVAEWRTNQTLRERVAALEAAVTQYTAWHSTNCDCGLCLCHVEAAKGE